MATRKGRRNSAGLLDPLTKRRRRYEGVLRGLGLWEAFAAMPRGVQDQFFQHKFPDPVVEFDGSWPGDAEHREIRKSIEAAFRSAKLSMGDADVGVVDFFSVIPGLQATVMGARIEPGVPEACEIFIRGTKGFFDQIFDLCKGEAFDEVFRAVILPLVAQGRLDGRLLTVTFKQEMTEHGKYVIKFIVSRAVAEAQRVRLDGVERPMYRVGSTNGWAGVRWISWEEGGAGRPVYVQSHALRQLRERVDLGMAVGYVEHWMVESLEKPKIVERQGVDLLVEYRVGDRRVGYLVVTPVEGAVAVRTFKFLTMENTPEARKLANRLKLTRRDVDWLGLHQLSAFTRTDLGGDPELRALMEECGCGHLFSLVDEDLVPRSGALAGEMRKYLRLEQNRAA